MYKQLFILKNPWLLCVIWCHARKSCYSYIHIKYVYENGCEITVNEFKKQLYVINLSQWNKGIAMRDCDLDPINLVFLLITCPLGIRVK